MPRKTKKEKSAERQLQYIKRKEKAPKPKSTGETDHDRKWHAIDEIKGILREDEEASKKVDGIVVDPISGIVDEEGMARNQILSEWVEGREDLLPSDMQHTVSAKNERVRLALNHLTSRSISSMSNTQMFIHSCSQHLFRPERLRTMTDTEIAETMMVAMSMFDKESQFVLKVAELNKDLSASPTKRNRLMDMIETLPRDVLESLVDQINGKIKQ